MSESQPPQKLYAPMLQNAQAKWAMLDTLKLKPQLAYIAKVLSYFKAQGCKIYFYEMPMDASLTKAKLLVYQRNYFLKMAKKYHCGYIGIDTAKTFTTGDGEHLLAHDADLFMLYLNAQIKQYF